MKTNNRVTLTKTADKRLRAAQVDDSITLDSFTNFSHKLGVGSDNPLSSSTYGFNPITRNRVMLEWIHRGSWIGGVAVDVVADDMTRAGIEMKTTLEPDQIEKIEEAAVTLKVWQGLNDLIKWDRLYGGALAVMLVDGQDMSTPLREATVRKGQFRGLMILDRWMVEPSLNELITTLGPDLGLPVKYRVMAGAPALQGSTVHHSRCIRMDGLRLPYWQRQNENLWGISVLERLYDRMIAFDSASTGAAQLVYKAYLRTYKINGLRSVIAAGGKPMEGLISYVDMMRRFQGIEGITLLDGEDTFEAHTHSAFAGLSDALTQFGQQLAGALQIPLVRLFGQSPSGFNSDESDVRSYYDGIKQKQEQGLRIPLTKIYHMMAASEGITVPEGFKLDFRSLWQLSDEQKAQIASTTVDTVTKAEESGLISQHVAMKELKQSSQITGIFSNITDKDMAAAEEDIPPPASLVMEKEGEGKPGEEKPKEKEGETKPDAPAKKDE